MASSLQHSGVTANRSDNSGSGSGSGAADATAPGSGSSSQKVRTTAGAPSDFRLPPGPPSTQPMQHSQQSQQQQQQQLQQQQQQQGPKVLTFALNHRPRATRASVPKVRTGCKTSAAAASQPATTSPARPQTTPRATPTTTPAGTPPGAPRTSNSPRLRVPTNTNNYPNPDGAPSTSSSSATIGSRRTTPASDVSATEFVPVPVSAAVTPRQAATARPTAPYIKREPGLDDEIDTQRARLYHPTNLGDVNGKASVASRPQPSARQPTWQPKRPTPQYPRTRTAYKREYEDDGDDNGYGVEAEYCTNDAYDVYYTHAPGAVAAQRNTFAQPFFDLALINGGAASSSFPLEPNYNSVMFASQWEKAYFDSWLTLAPNLGGGWFPSHLWTSTIPQLCRDEPAVRFAAIAIGAMAQAMSPALLGKSYLHMLGGGQPTGGQLPDGGAAAPALPSPADPSVSASSVVPHYRNALTYHGHALRLIRLGGGGRTAPGSISTGPSNNPTLVQELYTDNNPATPPSAEKERAAVLCCLLFVCFEALQGNREAALRHITSGLQIVDQFVARNLPPRALSEAQAYSPPDEASFLAGTDSDIEWQRRRKRQRQRDRQLGLLAEKNDPAGTRNSNSTADTASTTATGHDGHNGHRTTLSEDRPSDSLTRVLTRSPAPYVLEDEVMQVFRRLDFQAWSLGVFRLRRTRPADIKFQALDALNPATIPARFDTLDDARRWWDFVQHWILQFPRYMVAALQRYMDENPDAAARATAAGRMLDICDVPGAREIQRDYLHCLERWYAAFYPLYEATRRQGAHPGGSGGSGDPASATAAAAAEAAYFRAASLKIPYLLAWIGVSSLVYSDYEAMYQLTPQFRELNRLATLILPKQPRYAWSPFGGGASSIFGPPSGSPSPGNGGNGGTGGQGGTGGTGSGDLFTMDNGPTMALFVVSCKCRVEAVRDESIRLLAAYPRRDGFWDSKILWAIADWNRVIEAENETEGSLYEQWLRLRQREAIFDETKPEVQMTAWVKNKATGKFEKLTQTVRWDR
ncbi:hypothetical protein SPBR_08099 [Sporothrix brasiliensis 5110]|uniref:C6 zinc finger domain containing protein n=1 Tax=Sporothrix brasiliensis 5110 TaxID=1398154 RepID=A0A0C2IHM4_9PEZI|nr:uncharacterized protein SPBR_08099 [Sporothrix brasiliensis 5110]KIH86510.1 hypothetical protein SPBR_08099 [Sporothrix brasiliensis 5110]